MPKSRYASKYIFNAFNSIQSFRGMYWMVTVPKSGSPVFGECGGDDVGRELVRPGLELRKFGVDAGAGMLFGVVGHCCSWGYCTSRAAGELLARRSELVRVEVKILDGQVPVRVENLEAMLFFTLITLLIRKK